MFYATPHHHARAPADHVADRRLLGGPYNHLIIMRVRRIVRTAVCADHRPAGGAPSGFSVDRHNHVQILVFPQVLE